MTTCVLTIAASDPSGGAGIEADLKVFAAHGLFGLTAITALTVQDTMGVKGVCPSDMKAFERNLEIHRQDQPVAAIKIGALATAEHVEAVRYFLDVFDPLPPVVLDPVLLASSGAELLDPDAAGEIISSLLPYAAVVTPNLMEAERLAGIEVKDRKGMRRAAEALCLSGADATLVKGGHLYEDSHDVLCLEGRIIEYPNDRLPHEYHGTGCALSSGIASHIALGAEVPDAIERARAYLRKCMEAARPGRGTSWILDFPHNRDVPGMG